MSIQLSAMRIINQSQFNGNERFVGFADERETQMRINRSSTSQFTQGVFYYLFRIRICRARKFFKHFDMQNRERTSNVNLKNEKFNFSFSLSFYMFFSRRWKTF